MHPARRWPLVLLVALGFGHATGGLARAQDAGACEPPVDVGPLEVTPADGASSAPLDGVVRVRYSPGFFTPGAPPSQTITLTGPAGAVAGRVTAVGDDTLYFAPLAPLAANTSYTGAASGGVFAFTFGFRTGTAADTAPPAFGDPRDASGFRIDAAAADPSCSPAGSRRIGLTFPSAFDGTSPATSLEYWVYVTRGEGLDAPRLVARLRDFGAELTTAGFVVGPELGSGPLCVSVVAVDGLDRATEWPEPVCFDPQMGVGFVGLCAASMPGRPTRGHDGAPWVLAVLGLSGVLRRWRPRPRPA